MAASFWLGIRHAGVSQPAVSKHLTVLKRPSWHGAFPHAG
jgi:hypothetical protein